MTPAPTPVKSLKTTYNGHLVKRRNNEVFADTDHLPQQKVKISTTYGKSPPRSAGRCGWPGDA